MRKSCDDIDNDDEGDNYDAGDSDEAGKGVEPSGNWRETGMSCLPNNQERQCRNRVRIPSRFIKNKKVISATYSMRNVARSVMFQ